MIYYGQILRDTRGRGNGPPERSNERRPKGRKR
nr:MAG TPA: hypothetical protein [Caudoviricetes sp.]